MAVKQNQMYLCLMISTSRIFNIKTPSEFEALALEMFQFQYHQNRTYRSFCDLLARHPSDATSVSEIPFLPIECFKTHNVLSSTDAIESVFVSSGTTGGPTSAHHVVDLSIYRQSFFQCFELFYGENYPVILALLPSYLERDNASLVYMVQHLIRQSGHPDSGFYLDDLPKLRETLVRLESQGTQVLLIGVSFALLDFVDQYQLQLKHTMVMETGGMKGRRKELIRSELHEILKAGLGVPAIHSEYGMTELLSQAYSDGSGVFRTPPWMRVLTRDPDDPLTIQNKQRVGGINIIDLANVYACAFIATQDLGRVYDDASFEVLGRFDHSDIRGCSLMVV